MEQLILATVLGLMLGFVLAIIFMKSHREKMLQSEHRVKQLIKRLVAEQQILTTLTESLENRTKVLVSTGSLKQSQSLKLPIVQKDMELAITTAMESKKAKPILAKQKKAQKCAPSKLKKKALKRSK